MKPVFTCSPLKSKLCWIAQGKESEAKHIRDAMEELDNRGRRITQLEGINQRLSEASDNTPGRAFFYTAAMEGNLPVVMWLYSKGYYNPNALFTAALHGHLDVVQFLMIRGHWDLQAFKTAKSKNYTRIVEVMQTYRLVNNPNEIDEVD